MELSKIKYYRGGMELEVGRYLIEKEDVEYFFFNSIGIEVLKANDHTLLERYLIYDTPHPLSVDYLFYIFKKIHNYKLKINLLRREEFVGKEFIIFSARSLKIIELWN